jgi:hypothetical protein
MNRLAGDVDHGSSDSDKTGVLEYLRKVAGNDSYSSRRFTNTDLDELLENIPRPENVDLQGAFRAYVLTSREVRRVYIAVVDEQIEQYESQNLPLDPDSLEDDERLSDEDLHDLAEEDRGFLEDLKELRAQLVEDLTAENYQFTDWHDSPF